MQRKIRELFFIFLLTFIFVNTAFADEIDFSKLVILHTNDTHGYDEYNADGKNMGMAAIASIRDDYISKGKNVLLVDAGDYAQDNILVNYRQGHAAIDFMNATGYDVATVGNHDFSFGQDNLLKYAQEANFPIVTCNVFKKDGTTLLESHAVIEKGTLKIGIIGITTPETKTAITPSAVEGLSFSEKYDLYSLVQKEVNNLKSQRCHLIIALGHLGNEEALAGNTSKDVIANVQGIDIFIDGHDHALVENVYPNGTTLLAEVGDHTRYLGMISYKEGKWIEDLIPYKLNMPQKTEVAAIITKEKELTEAAFGHKIGRSDYLLNGANKICRSKETNLSDLFTDALLWQAKKDIYDNQDMLVIQNGGGIRNSITAGEITGKDVLNAFPYDNTLYCIKVTGETILEILEAACQDDSVTNGAFPCIANAKVSINRNVPYVKGDRYDDSDYYAPAAPGARIKIYEIDGKPFDINKVYNLVCNSFMLQGGDTYAVLKKPGTVLSAVLLSCSDSITVMNYIQEELKGVIPAKYIASQGRFIKVGEYEADSPNTKSLTETRATGMAILNNAADFAIGKGFMSAQAAAEADAAAVNKDVSVTKIRSGFTPFAAFGGSNMRYNTGSYVDSKGWGINVGFARVLHYTDSKLTLAPFVEYGKASYDSYLESDVHGSGDNSFTGIGFMAKQEQKDGLYYEGSVRLGRSKGDYTGEWYLGNYDTASNYLAFHAGIGQVLKLSEKDSIDFYGKVFYTHQNGDTVTVKRPLPGDSFVYNFDAINSYRLRLGTRFSQKYNKTDSVFVGLAWDYEFDSEARAHYNGISTPSPSMKGASGMLEVGWKPEATKDNPLGAEVGLTGWYGKQEGITFNAGFSWAF